MNQADTPPNKLLTKDVPSVVRDSKFELLRIFAMMLIVMHHIVVHIFDLKKLSYATCDENLSPTLLLVNSFAIIGVNLFVLISGYFTINLNLKSILRYYSFCIFYGLIDGILCNLVGVNFTKLNWVGIFLFGWFNCWWFVQSYLYLMLLSPILNKALNHSTSKELMKWIFLLLVLNCIFGWLLRGDINKDGHNLSQLVLMYMIGTYLSKSDFVQEIKNINLLKIGLLMWLLTGSLSIVLYSQNYQTLTWWLFAYNSPFCITLSIVVFIGFMKINIKSTIINFLGISIFGIYLLQDGLFGRYVYKIIQNNPSFGILCIYVVCIFIIVLVLDQMRKFFLDVIIKRVPQKTLSYGFRL